MGLSPPFVTEGLGTAKVFYVIAWREKDSALRDLFEKQFSFHRPMDFETKYILVIPPLFPLYFVFSPLPFLSIYT